MRAEQRPGIGIFDPEDAPPATTTYQHIRRVVDTVVSALALVVLALPMAAIAVAVRLDSEGPALFRQARVGYLGKTFFIVKFRTMTIDAPHFSAKMSDAHAHVTSVGRILRVTGLDELPQLWNVLRGEMALIGPRPEQLGLIVHYTPEQMKRHLVRPGITGWWQVHHRDTEAMRGNIEKDLYYIEKQSPILDAIVIGKTVSILVRAGLALLTRE
jgi:lipopolysaccharide/colanic/teichoic acid biosynthesis glycosyltransferase